MQDVCKTLKFEEDESVVKMAYKLIFESETSPATILRKVNVPALRTLSFRLCKDPLGSKAILIQRLVSNSYLPLSRLAYFPEQLGLRTSGPVPPLGPQPDISSLPDRISEEEADPNVADQQEKQKFSRFVPIMGQQLLEAVHGDIERTIAPHWLKASPKNVGDVKHGKLSSKEWRSIFTVSFPVTLIREWGADYRGRPSTGKHEVMDNFLHLAIAILLSTQREMSETVADLYRTHIEAYLYGYMLLYPTHSIVPYHHLLLHLPDFLKALGPWDTWGMGPYEMFIGMAQKIRTNSQFGAHA